VFFLGDTAKVVSPFGARGGNTGIADADNLAWKLAAVVRQQAPAVLLDSYHQERLQAARRNVQVTNRTARYLRAPEGIERLFRRATIGLAKRHGFARPLINTGRMAEANRYNASSVCQAEGGFMVQNIGVQFTSKQSGCLGDLLLWADSHLLLLVFGQSTPQELKQMCQLSQTDRVRVVQVLRRRHEAQALEHVMEADGLLQQACGDAKAKWALLRPDAYLVARGQALNGHLVQSVAKAYALA
jgi:3-(3-hydroxy-phenyl)propionate hydroxylase